MNSKGKIENDILGKYIDREKIEKAPEGFTEKIMNRIEVEKSMAGAGYRVRANVLVPVFSIVIALVLIALAFIYSSPSDNQVNAGISAFFQNLKIPAIELPSIKPLSLPSVVIYISVGFLFLSLFDRVLNRLFHKHG
jgi:hypothetical protein